MTLMTTDVDRVSEFSWHVFSLVGASRRTFRVAVMVPHHEPLDSPIEIVIGSYFLYKLLGGIHEVFLCPPC